MSEEAYARLTRTFKIGEGTLTLRGETGEEIADALKSIAEVSADLAAGDAVIKAAFGVVETTGTDAKPAAATAKRETQTRQSRTYGKTVKPGPTQAASEDHCSHGKPWVDLLGGTNKDGELYKFRFYNTCKNRECKPWGENE